MDSELNRPIKIVIADDHEIMRKGLSLIFSGCSDFELIGEAANGSECCAIVQKQVPHVVLMDLRMPILDGIEATKKIKSSQPDVKVIALTAVEDEDEIFRALDVGVDGYILKGIAVDELREAIITVCRGDSYLHPDVAKKVRGKTRRTQETDSLTHGLTDREMLVLRLMAEGGKNKHIARNLFVSEETVKSHVSNILSKLQQPDRIHAVLFALRHGLVELDRGETVDKT